MNTDEIFTQTIRAPWLHEHQVTLDVLRLDVMHPVVSGNKWFKLKYYLQDAAVQGKDTIATFGGAYSNHLLATAFACKQFGLNSVAFVRGEKPATLSPTLQYARQLNMKLIFATREDYREKNALLQQYQQPNWYVVNEGGYGQLGAKGASEILNFAGNDYTHIIASAGTGTMLAGLIMSAQTYQQVVGISSMKGNADIENAVKHLLTNHPKQAGLFILHDYHFGGYAKHPQALLAFINQAWQQFQLPLDIVYTGKTFFAIMDLVAKKIFMPGSKLLMIHSGGLQGNNSLTPNKLPFS